METINDTSRLGGIFTFNHIRGVEGVLDDARKKAILDEGGAEALVHLYLTRMGGGLVETFDAKNRMVTDGLALIINFLKGTGGTTVPTKVQLGNGSTGAGSWSKALTGVRSAITTNGLGEDTADSITIGTTTDTGDKLTFVNDFHASGTIMANEVAIRSTVPKCLCYAPFSGDRNLTLDDHLIVTYNFTLVP